MAEEYKRETTAIDTVVPLSPTAGALSDILSKAAGARTFDKATDSLEAIRDKINTISTPVSNASATTTGVIVEDGTSGVPSTVDASSSATANTFGSWVQVDASVSADSWINAIIMVLIPVDAANFVVEVGIGAAGAESNIIRFSNYLRVGSDTESISMNVYSLSIPIKIASGTRIAVRVADSRTVALTYRFGVQYYQSIET